MENKLTAQIAAAYFGCNAERTQNGGLKTRIVDGDFLGMFNSSIEAYQLILSPLSSITDEHAIEVAKMLDEDTAYGFGKQYYDIVYLDARDYINNIDYKQKAVRVKDADGNVFDTKLMIDCADGMQRRDITDHLRSNGYDCGYGSIPSLIESGIAIEKK